MPKSPSFPATFKMVQVEDVSIPIEKFQRLINEPRGRKLAREWAWENYDPIKLYETEDGYETYEGGHRVLAARILDLHELPALIYPITDIIAAQAFSRQSRNRRNISRYDEHKAGLFAGNDAAIQIEECVEGAGFKFVPVNTTRKSGIRAVGTIYQIVAERGLDHLARTLRFGKNVWPHSERVADGAFLAGLSEFLYFYEDRLGAASLQLLKEMAPGQFLSEAEGFQQKTRKSRVAAALRRASKVRKLPSVPF